MEETMLNIDNILGADEIDNLFVDESSVDDNTEEHNDSEKQKDPESTEDINIETLFNNPESVGSEEIEEDTQEEPSSEKKSSSPQKHFYSSIAQALKEEGVFPDVEDDLLNNIENPEDFRNLIESQIQAGLQERQRQIDEALKVGIEPSKIQSYEQVISVLSSIKDDDISAENDKGEQLRKDLIYQDFINRGYSEERAKREVKKSFDSGSDIEDAKEALKANLDFYKNDYNSLIEENKKKESMKQEALKRNAQTLKQSIFEDKNFLGELEVDKNTRKKVFENISKPIYKNPETGEYLTALQKYEQENKLDFLKNVGLLYTLTDGFKNIDKIVKPKVNKEVKKGLKELERTLNNTRRDHNGNLQYVSSVNDDTESFIGKGWNLDV